MPRLKVEIMKGVMGQGGPSFELEAEKDRTILDALEMVLEVFYGPEEGELLTVGLELEDGEDEQR